MAIKKQAVKTRRESDPDLEPKNLESLLSFRLTNLSRKFAIGGSRIFQTRFGVNARELRVLLILGNYGSLTSTEIAAVAHMDKGTISRAVKALMQRGMILGEVERQDLRRSSLRLTATGQEHYEACFAASKARMVSVLEVLDADERRQLATLLNKVETRLDDLNENLTEPSADESEYMNS